MKIKSVSFENYKAFAEKQTLELRPITLLIGKNSSGKSSIAKLFTLLENSLSGKIEEPLLMNNSGVELGAEFKDLVFGRYPNTPISFTIEYDDGTILSVKIVQEESYQLHILEWEFNGFLIKYLKDNIYVDSQGNKYECFFKGIMIKGIFNEESTSILNEVVLSKYRVNAPIDKKIAFMKIDVDYIGPFRILPERQFHLTGQLIYQDTGIKGENAYSLLGVSKLMKNRLHEQVGEWYSAHFDGWALKVIDKNKPYIEIVLSKNDVDVNIVDVGQGMNQVLPLVVRSFLVKKDSLIVLEQPELHLHPAAHGDLAELFAKSAKDNNQTFLIETHSENIILRLRNLIIENDFGFTHDDVIIYWIDDAEGSGQEINEITIDEEGVLSDWPEGVFNENLKEILKMQNALNKKHKQKLEKYLLQKSGSITQLHKLHLNHFTIGLTNGEVNPFDAYRIIAERSKIVVENGINDGKFIKGICEKYTNHRKRGNIYKLIKKAFNNEWIESEGGGIGEIKKTVEKWINSARYKDIHQYKVMTLFDSDRLAHNDFDVKHKDLISFLKIKPKNYNIQLTDCVHESSDLILWHILYKRKLENYVPLNVLFNSISTLTDNQKADLRVISIQDLDFHEYDSAKIGLSAKKIKEQFPDMFLTAFSMYDMEARCEHHKILMTLSNGTVEEVSEIEQILLKIAKII